MMIKAKNTIMKERIWIKRVASEIVFQPLHPDTGALLHSRGYWRVERGSPVWSARDELFGD